MTSPDRRFDQPPGLAELHRRLDGLDSELREQRRSLEATYVRLDVYRVEQAALLTVTAELRRDLDAIVEQQRANRRLAVSGIVLPALAGVLTALLLLALPTFGAPS